VTAAYPIRREIAVITLNYFIPINDLLVTDVSFQDPMFGVSSIVVVNSLSSLSYRSLFCSVIDWSCCTKLEREKLKAFQLCSFLLLPSLALFFPCPQSPTPTKQ
jgi:hypothetical protein